MEQEELNELIVQRLKKLKALVSSGEPSFKARFQRTHLNSEIIREYEKLEPGEKTGKRVKVAGRIMTFRRHGKASFAVIRDGSDDLQLYLTVDLLGENDYKRFLGFDIGDFVGCEGEVFKTHRGEISVAVEKFELLTKALRPLPEKWHGLRDIELRHRQRYLDLLMNHSVKETFILKNKVIKNIRHFLDERGFVEVETPVLQPIPGGATARPFVTFHHTLDTNLYLRIAPELYLKRLVIGGLEKVYELNKSFRNEGISVKHNPEFLMLEVYQAYADYNDMMNLTEELIVDLVRDVKGETKINYQEYTLDFSPPWARMTMLEAIEKLAGVKVSFKQSIEKLEKTATNLGIDLESGLRRGEIVGEIFEKVVEEKIIQPTFILDYPLEISPLARRHPKNPNLTERFELIIVGREIANAFSELTDPREQRERFEEQLKRGRVEEGQRVDEDFIKALEYGMPPTGGLGIGIDRLVMFLTDSYSIREVILFPQLKPEKE